MDMFVRGKSKPKRRPDPPTPIISTPIPQRTSSHGPNSPSSPTHVSSNSAYTSIASTNTDDYFSGRGDESSIRSSQSTSYSIPSNDGDGYFSQPDKLCNSEIEELFEKMLTRRGIHDSTARNVMMGFSIEKKRLMVTQDIQAESITASNTPSTTSSSKRSADRSKEVENSPEYFVKKLSEKMISSKIIAHLAVGLRTMPLSWVRQFIEMDGLELVTDSLANINNIKQKRDIDIQIEGDLLKCFKALLNNRIGAKEALKHPHCVQHIVNCIVSPSIINRRLVCEVLVFLCYFQAISQEIILKAMDHLRDTTKGLGRFDLWLHGLDSSLGGRGRMGSMVGASEDFKRLGGHGADNQLTEYALYNMIFVNAIINVVEDTEVRIHLRNQLHASGLEQIMEKMSELSSEQIDRQILEYKTWAENDHDEIMEIYHERVLRDMNDPRDVFECVLTSVEGTRGYDFFLSCLQHLLLINEEEGGLKSRYFQIIDNLITQVVLDHKGLAEDFSSSYGTSVRHLVDKFADQDQLLATLEEIHNLQEMYDEVVRERDDLKVKLSEGGVGNNEDSTLINQLKEKTASLEDLLRMSRHTITTLQGKLRDLQSNYDKDLENAQKQLDMFYKAVDDENDNDESEDIILKKADFARAVSRIRAQESLEGKSNQKRNSNDVKEEKIPDVNKHKSIALGLSEEFKNQLAMQFGSSSGLSDFVLPGTLPLMGSAQRRPRPFRRQIYNDNHDRSNSIISTTSQDTASSSILTGNNDIPLSPTSTKNSQVGTIPSVDTSDLVNNNSISNSYDDNSDILDEYSSLKSPQKSNLSDKISITSPISKDHDSNLSILSDNISNNQPSREIDRNSSSSLAPQLPHSVSNINVISTTNDSPNIPDSSNDTVISPSLPSSMMNRTSSIDNNGNDNAYETSLSTFVPPPPPPQPSQMIDQSSSVDSNSISSSFAPPPPPPPPPPPMMNQDLSTGSNNSSSLAPPPPPPPPPPPSLMVRNSSQESSFTAAIKKQAKNNDIRKSFMPSKALNIQGYDKENNETSAPYPPPPPSAPPNPLTPSAPLPPSGNMRKRVKHLPNVKTRALQWQKINMPQIKSTIWESNESTEMNLEDKMDIEGIFNKMEEMFAQKVIEPKKKKILEKKQEICIIDSRKASNITKCKHMSFDEIKRKILAVDEKFCTEIILRSMLVNAPTPEEMGKLSVFLKTAPEEDLQNLSRPDAFCAEIMSIDRFKERIDCMHFKVTFSERITQLSRNMSNVMEASTSIKESEAFKDFLNIILLVGNFLNGTNFQGGAFGVRIGSINKLVDTKSSDTTSTLLHFLINIVEEKFQYINDKLLDDLQLCGEACRVTIQDLIKDYNELRVGLQKIIHELDRHYGDDYDPPEGDKYVDVLTDFRDIAVEKFDQLEVRYTAMDIAYKDVVTYFGENPNDMKPDEFFSIFKTFTSSWEKARSDLETIRKRKEQAEKAKKYEEERKERLKQSRSGMQTMDMVSENQEDKHIMDNLLERLRSGEMATATKQRSRRNTLRERRRTRSESVMIKAEDLLKHMQNESEASANQPRSRSNSKRLASSERMRRLASLAEEMTMDT